MEETVGTNISQDTDNITKLEIDEQSTASSSTIPSLNDLDVEMDQMYNQDADSTSKYGGLHNMGNTCYLNSALQMVASLDNFRSLLNECNITTTESKLRDLLLNVLERLERGETLRPTALKREIDEKTPLFIGYRQQDSHEFLTTLLDLIDEEYKKEANYYWRTVQKYDMMTADTQRRLKFTSLSTLRNVDGDLFSTFFIGLMF